MPLRVKAYCERVLRRRRHRMYCAYIVSSNHDGLRVRGHLPIAIDFETDPIDVQLRPAPVDFTLASLRMCESCGRVDGDIECRSTKLVTQTHLMTWLLKRIQAKSHDENRAYAAELLSILLQNRNENRLVLSENDGIEIILRVLSVIPISNQLQNHHA